MARLSICIPTYNRASKLADRLKRMEAMQSKIEIEIAMSDNCSADNTRDVAESFRKSFAGFRYTRQQSVIPPILNFYAAMRSATFDYLIQIGDDDCIIENSMLEALSFFESEPALQALIGNKERFNFSTGQSEGVVPFVCSSERYDIRTAGELFVRNYFFEYLVTKRAPVHRHFFNEGLSYPLGWKLLQSCFREGTVALEPLPLIHKDSNPARLGYRNFIIELQDLARSDSEYFAALSLPTTPAEDRTALCHAARMRTVRYSSDARVNAREQGNALISLHYAQKASLYDYDVGSYPATDPGLSIIDLLAHRIAGMADTLMVEEILLEEGHSSARLLQPLTALMKGSRTIIAPAATLRGPKMTQRLVVSHEYDAAIAAFASAQDSFHYCALTDLLYSCIEKPSDYPDMKALLEAPLPILETAA